MMSSTAVDCSFSFARGNFPLPTNLTLIDKFGWAASRVGSCCIEQSMEGYLAQSLRQPNAAPEKGGALMVSGSLNSRIEDTPTLYVTLWILK
jgi:hypothetical protein